MRNVPTVGKSVCKAVRKPVQKLWVKLWMDPSTGGTQVPDRIQQTAPTGREHARS